MIDIDILEQSTIYQLKMILDSYDGKNYRDVINAVMIRLSISDDMVKEYMREYENRFKRVDDFRR